MSSSTSSYEETSSEESTPIGFNKEAFLNRARERKAQIPVMARKTFVIEDKCTVEELKYENLLKRAHMQFKSEVKNKVILKLPLDLKREKHCKTSLNLVEIAQVLNRDADHIKSYLFSELLTTGSVNEKGILYMKGVFLKNHIHGIFKKYVDDFVLCNTCENTSDTSIIRENKLYYVSCKSCGGRKYVGNISEGLKNKK